MPTNDFDKIPEESPVEIPQWQKTLIDLRLAKYNNNPEDTLDWEQVSKELEQEELFDFEKER